MKLKYKDIYNLPHTNIRIHGNGFLQLDLPENNRINVFDGFGLPRQDVYTGLHNHRFDFHSKILTGKLIHTQYEEFERNLGGKYILYHAVKKDKENTILEPISDFRYDFYGKQVFNLSKNSDYEFKANKFHESFSDEITVTLLKKGKIFDIEPIVACEYGQKPDNDFDRFNIPSEKLWKYFKGIFEWKIKEIEI